MSRKLKTTFEGVMRALKNSLSSGVLEEKMQQASKKAGIAIVDSNQETLSGLQSTITRTGPLTWSISFMAPGLWPSVFGTTTTEEVPFETSAGGEA